MDDDRLADHHVIVTGGARGIGAGIARRIAKAGADVTIFDTDVASARGTAEQIRDLGGETSIVDVDVSNVSSVKTGLEEAIEQLGPVDGLVNNAGVQDTIPVLKTTEEQWDYHLDVNAKGTFLCSKLVVQHMIEEALQGSIVNVASTAAERAFPGQGAYAASKAGVVAFTQVLAKELGEYRINVNAINPGTVDTPMVQQWLEEHAADSDTTEEAFLEDALTEHIIDRIGQPEEIGHVATLLLSEEGDWVTGETINVDGGYTSN